MGPAPAKRLFKDKEDNREIVYPKIDYTHGTNKGTAVMRPPTKIKKKPEVPKYTKPEIKKPIKKSKYVDTINNDQGIRPNIPAVNFGKASTEFESELDEVKKLLNKLLQEKHNLNGKATYNVNYQVIEPNIHGVVMKKPTEKTDFILLKDLEKDRFPGPGRYHADDRVIHDKEPAFTFKKQPRKNRTPPPDKRRYLDVNLDAVKKRAKAVKFMPEHAPPKQKIDEMIRVGPATYKLNHKYTEARVDVNTVKWIPDKEKVVEIDERPELMPNFDIDKFEKGVPLYKEPTDHKPKHIPDAAKNPEKWRFYDPNLDAIKEVQQAHDFAENLKRDEFINRDEYLKDYEEFKQRHNKVPDIYSYDYQEKDTKIPFDFGKLVPRVKYEDSALLLEFDKEGEVLILDPDKPKKRIPGFEFAKMKDRFQPDGLLEEDHKLILDPSDKLTKKRPITLVNIDKDKSRVQPIIDEDDIPNNFLTYENPFPKNPKDPAIEAHNFGKATERFKKKFFTEDEIENALILDPEQPRANKAKVKFNPLPKKDRSDLDKVKEVVAINEPIKEEKYPETQFFNRQAKLENNKKKEEKARKEKHKREKKYYENYMV